MPSYSFWVHNLYYRFRQKQLERQTTFTLVHSGFVGFVDRPNTVVVRSAKVAIDGWLAAQTPNEAYSAIRLRHHDRLFGGRCALPRDDVAAALPGVPGAARCGFEFFVSLPNGPCSLALEVQVASSAWIHVGNLYLFVMDGTSRRLFRHRRPIARPLHVVLDGRMLHRHTTGTERYLRNIILHMAEQAGVDDQLDVLVWFPVADPVPGVRYLVRNHLEAIREGDVFFKTFPAGERVYLEEMAAARSCVFVPQDLIIYSHPDYTPTIGDHLDYCIRLYAAVRLATGIIAISSHNASDMRLRLPVPPIVSTVLDGVDGSPRRGNAALLAPLALTPGRFLLCVGTNYPHKNTAALVEAFVAAGSALAEYQLILVGMRFHEEGARGLPERVRHLDHVDEEVLAALYGHAAALVYPSLYEGFGLPPVEAMQVGLPVAASDATSLPEVCGDAALFFDARKIDSIREALIRIVRDEALRKRLREAGRRRAKDLTWDETARKTWSVLRSAANAEQSRPETRAAILREAEYGCPLGPSVVLLTHVPLHSPGAGNERRIINMVRYLRSRGYRVVLVYTPLERTRCSIPQRYRVLESVDLFYEILPGVDDGYANVSRWLGPWDGTAAEPALLRWKQQELTFCPDATRAAVHEIVERLHPIAVIAEYIWTSRALTALPSGVLRIIDTIDMFSAKASQVIQHGVQDVLSIQPDEERLFLDRADVILAIQPEEARKFAELGTRARVITVGCDMPAPPDGLSSSKEPTVLIVGSDNHINAHFVGAFVKEVWPRVSKAVPAARLIVAGRVANTIPKNPPDGVILKGYCADLRELYASCTVVINPVVAGTGLKIKSVEALAHGKPLVTTREGAAGLPLHQEPYLLLAETPEEWVDRLSHLLLSPASCDRFARAAASVAKIHFSPEAVYAPLLELLRTRTASALTA
jgi:glycosyltransferase involved in cell wall biosynthesis